MELHSPRWSNGIVRRSTQRRLVRLYWHLSEVLAHLENLEAVCRRLRRQAILLRSALDLKTATTVAQRLDLVRMQGRLAALERTLNDLESTWDYRRLRSRCERLVARLEWRVQLPRESGDEPMD